MCAENDSRWKSLKLLVDERTLEAISGGAALSTGCRAHGCWGGKGATEGALLVLGRLSCLMQLVYIITSHWLGVQN